MSDSLRHEESIQNHTLKVLAKRELLNLERRRVKGCQAKRWRVHLVAKFSHCALQFPSRRARRVANEKVDFRIRALVILFVILLMMTISEFVFKAEPSPSASIQK